jgi:O-antigen ligase
MREFVPLPRRALYPRLPPSAAALSPSAPAATPLTARTLLPSGSRLLMVFAILLLLVHLGRFFDYFLTGFRIPAVICGIAILVSLFSGAWINLKRRVGLALAIFIAWMAAVSPFSLWKGGSAGYVWQFLAMSLVAMLVFAAAPKVFGGLRKLFYATFFFVSLNLFLGGAAQSGVEDTRLSFAGVYGNADEIAIFAGFAIPFWIFLSLQVKPQLLRVPVLLAGCFFLLRTIGLTGTRTAVLALGAMLVVYLVRATMMQRILVLATALLAGAILTITLPSSVLERFATIDDSFSATAVAEQQVESEAMASAAARRKLMLDAVDITLRHPLTGVGPGQFSTYRGDDKPGDYGRRRSWQNTHCAYLQVSSESGVPGLVFYLIFLGSIYQTIRVIRKLNAPGAHPDWRLGNQMAMCLELALVYFLVCAAFMCCTEYIIQFILGGLALAAERITRFQIDMARLNPRPPDPLGPATALQGPLWPSKGENPGTMVIL